jgi:hypothetical protein
LGFKEIIEHFIHYFKYLIAMLKKIDLFL